MKRAGEHDGRTAVEVLLTALVLAAIVVPMAGGVALAEARTKGRRTRAAAVAREVLAQVVARGGASGGTSENPLALPDDLVCATTKEGFEVRVYFDRARRGRARTPASDSGTAWVDVLDSTELATSGDPFRALLAHRAQSIVSPASSGHPVIRDVSL